MTSQKDFIGRLEDYLDEYEGATPLPESVRDAVRAQLPTTKQIGPLSGPMRYPSMIHMSTAAKYGLVAAVVVAAAVLGAAYFGGGENVGGGNATPTPEPSPEVIQPLASGHGEDGRELAAGTYTAELAVPVTFTVPDGWTLWAYTSAATQLNLFAEQGELSVEIVDNVAADPCTGELLDPPVGPSVDDLVTALSNLANFGFEVSTPTDITIDGFSGKQLTMTAPQAPAGCELRTWRTTTRQNGVASGEVNEVRIIDVDGVRLLISVANPPTGDRSEIDGIINSLQFSP
jgi:hypothetical protein